MSRINETLDLLRIKTAYGYIQLAMTVCDCHSSLFYSFWSETGTIKQLHFEE